MVLEVVAILKLVAKTGVGRATCFTGAYMGGNECRKPSRCVEAIEHFENVVNSNGSSASVRSLESWIGSASQNKNCAVAIAGGPIVSAARNAVSILDDEAKKNQNTIQGAISTRRVFIKSGVGNYWLNHSIASRAISLADQPYNPATGAYDGELWQIVDARGGRVFIKSAHGNYWLNHSIASRAISLADQPYNSATGAYDGELWQMVAR